MDKNDLIEKILATIVKNKVGQKPRWLFVVENFGRWSLLVSGFALVIFVVSFIFWSTLHGFDILQPNFSGSEIFNVLKAIPSWVWILSLGLFVGAVYMVVSYTRAYKKPLAKVAVVIAILVGASALGAAATPIHRELTTWSEESYPPVVSQFYENARPIFKRVVTGEIESVEGLKFILDNDNLSGETDAKERTEFTISDDFKPAGENWQKFVGQRAAVILDKEMKSVIKIKPLLDLDDQAMWPQPALKRIRQQLRQEQERLREQRKNQLENLREFNKKENELEKKSLENFLETKSRQDNKIEEKD